MIRFFLQAVFLFSSASLFAQNRVITRSGTVSFYSKAPLENIEATSHTALSVVDKKTGRIEFAVLIKSFEFEKALMQEHFNENYLESDKFPKSTFKGTIDNLSKIDFSQDGKYVTSASGQLTIHGKTKSVTAPLTLIVDKGQLNAACEFSVLLADYEITIPSLVKDKVSKTVKINVNAKYLPL